MADKLISAEIIKSLWVAAERAQEDTREAKKAIKTIQDTVKERIQVQVQQGLHKAAHKTIQDIRLKWIASENELAALDHLDALIYEAELLRSEIAEGGHTGDLAEMSHNARGPDPVELAAPPPPKPAQRPRVAKAEPSEPDADAAPKRRGRPAGSKNKPKEPSADATKAAADAAEQGEAHIRRSRTKAAASAQAKQVADKYVTVAVDETLPPNGSDVIVNANNEELPEPAPQRSLTAAEAEKIWNAEIATRQGRPPAPAAAPAAEPDDLDDIPVPSQTSGDDPFSGMTRAPTYKSVG